MITSIGNPVFDLIETQYLKSDGRVLSGCSTNACLVLSKLGMETAIVGRVGNDFAALFQSEMDRFNIKYFVEDAPESGGFKLVYTDDHGNRTLELLGDAGDLSVFPEDYKNSDWILFGPILREVDIDYVWLAKRRALESKIFIDPQGFIRYHENGEIIHKRGSEIEEIAELADVFKPNEMECKVLTGIDPREDYETPAKIIKSWGAKLVVITLAELGSIIYDGKEFYRIPAYETTAKDSTGAGDAYAGGLIYALEHGYDLFEAGCFASAVSSIMVENCGPDFPLTIEEAERRKEILMNLDRQ